jgi:pimeloyl-[acyl-carrier protein] methyl ester esterase
LSDSFRVITVDLPGHGKSPAPVGGFNLKGCADDIVEFIESLDLHKVLLAGWSLGSLIVLVSFETLRDRLSGVVLISGTPRFTQGADFPYGLPRIEVDGMTRKVQRSLRRALEGFTARMFAAGELDDQRLAVMVHEVLSSVPIPAADVALQSLEVLIETDLCDRLALIDRPTLIMNGDCDVICLPQASELLAQHVAAARQIIFSGCAHAPFLTQSSRFNACLEEFRGMVSNREY